MEALELKEEKKVELVFEDGDKNKALKAVIITSEKFEGLQVKMVFVQKNGRTSLQRFNWIGDYIPTDDSGWIPGRLFDPAILQTRAIFSDYRRRKKNKKASLVQARLIP
ncbi:MAG: hypothetical protein Q8M00_02215 [bacterium]|nr:hypothetical protein [bacterium]